MARQPENNKLNGDRCSDCYDTREPSHCLKTEAGRWSPSPFQAALGVPTKGKGSQQQNQDEQQKQDELEREIGLGKGPDETHNRKRDERQENNGNQARE